MSPLQLHPTCEVVNFDLLDLALDGAEGETQVMPPTSGGGCQGLFLPSQEGMLPASKEGRGLGFFSGGVDNHIFIGNKVGLP